MVAASIPFIATMWKKPFSQILNSSQSDKEHDFFVDHYIGVSEFERSDDLLSSPNIIESLLYKLPLNSASGFDQVSAEHLGFADPSICEHLSVFINMCIIHGCLPETCMTTILTPIAKTKMVILLMPITIVLLLWPVLFLNCLSILFCPLYSLFFKLVTTNLASNLIMVLTSVIFT